MSAPAANPSTTTIVDDSAGRGSEKLTHKHDNYHLFYAKVLQLAPDAPARRRRLVARCLPRITQIETLSI
jgi:hypothetical protein